MFEEFSNLFESSPLGNWEAAIRISFSLAASVIAYLLYQLFYGSRHIGAGVNRTFLIGGPAITMLFLVIQTSIPLGVGLLGALSFVRFRTPIKDPAEIGFLLLLIASSIGAATGNLVPTAILFAAVFLTLGVQRLIGNRVTLFGRGNLIISLDQPSFSNLEKKLKTFLGERLNGLSLDTMSTLDDRVSLHYQYRKQKGFDWAAFTSDLNALAGETRVDVFVG
ncbi:MAG: DUF4956 domain-containing protein [Dehalococcoidales bacterium]|nr:DUF4956 domain-containing protein [Dehalococcoidales bacterium]